MKESKANNKRKEDKKIKRKGSHFQLPYYVLLVKLKALAFNFIVTIAC